MSDIAFANTHKYVSFYICFFKCDDFKPTINNKFDISVSFDNNMKNNIKNNSFM